MPFLFTCPGCTAFFSCTSYRLLNSLKAELVSTVLYSISAVRFDYYTTDSEEDFCQNHTGWQIRADCPFECRWGQQHRCFLAQCHAGSSCFIHETMESGLLFVFFTWPTGNETSLMMCRQRNNSPTTVVFELMQHVSAHAEGVFPHASMDAVRII